MVDEINDQAVPAVVPPDPAANQGQPAAPQTQPQQAPYAGYQAQPVYATQPQAMYAPAAPVLTQLTGGMKFGWLVVGMFMGITGILLAWLTNADKYPQVKSDALKFAVIGLVINIVAIILISAISGALLTALVANLSNYWYYY